MIQGEGGGGGILRGGLINIKCYKIQTYLKIDMILDSKETP